MTRSVYCLSCKTVDGKICGIYYGILARFMFVFFRSYFIRTLVALADFVIHFQREIRVSHYPC